MDIQTTTYVVEIDGGDAVDGHNRIGPFDTAEDGFAFMDGQRGPGLARSFSVVPVHAPPGTAGAGIAEPGWMLREINRMRADRGWAPIGADGMTAAGRALPADDPNRMHNDGVQNQGDPTSGVRL